MTTITLADGTITRQLLPYGMAKQGMHYSTDFVWVTWDQEPITLEMAAAHLVLCGGMSACVVRCRRGPKGGWTGASFVTAAGDLPKPAALLPRRTTDNQVIEALTLYYGWKQSRKGPGRQGNEPIPLPKGVFGDHYRAHLALHA